MRPGKDSLLEMTLIKGTEVHPVAFSLSHSDVRSISHLHGANFVSSPRNVIQIDPKEFTFLQDSLKAKKDAQEQKEEILPPKADSSLEIDRIGDGDYEFEELRKNKSPFGFETADSDNTHITSYYYADDKKAKPEQANAPKIELSV